MAGLIPLETWEQKQTVAQWPTPQPIETAPRARILAWYPSSGWVVEEPGPADTPGGWTDRRYGRTHWLPMPPPPQNNKEVR